MNIQRNHWKLWPMGILMMLSLHLTESTRCDWKHSITRYDLEPCETTTVVCRNITTATLDDFHDEQITEDCYSKRCYGIDIHNSDINSINKEMLAVKLACKLYEITLTKDHIHTIANDTFADCPKVWNLNLEDNLITATNFLVGEFKNLRILNLAHNKLKSLQRTTFDSLKVLDKLYLNNNLLDSIEDDAFKSLLNLSQLFLNNNNLQSISLNMFQGLNKLNYLYLQENPIKSITPGAFSSLNNLVFLNLSGSNIDTLKNNSFIGLSHLETLNLTNLNIKNIEPGAFSTMYMLKSLDLHQNNLASIEENIFFDLHVLKFLDLSFNKISSLKLESFTGLINLRRLFLNDNIIKEIPFGTFQSFPLLENLQLGNNYLSHLKSESFSNLQELKYLNLSHNVFSELDVTVLFSLTRLTSLKLDNNHLSRLNHKILLLHLPHLSFISVNNNNWTCSLLAEMLKAFKARKIEYLFNQSLEYPEDNVQGIFCTNRTVQENNPENLPLINNPIQLEKMLKELTSSTQNLTEILNTTKKRIEELSHNSIIEKANYYFPENVQKNVKDILNNSLLTNGVLNNLQGNFTRLSLNINNVFKDFETNFEKISEVLKENQNNAITQEKFLKVIGNLSKTIDSNEPKPACNSNNGLYIISVFVLILFTIIVVLLVFKYFQTYKRNICRKSRSEIELLNAS